ncbi:MAG: hypothetical protein ABIQ33_09375 [Caldimonas sp.]
MIRNSFAPPCSPWLLFAFGDDQSATNALYVRGPNADEVIKTSAR